MKKLFAEMMEGSNISDEGKEALVKRFTEMFESAVEESAAEKLEALKEETLKSLEEANVEYKALLAKTSEESLQTMIESELAPRIEKFAVHAATTIHNNYKDQIAESARVELADALLSSIAESASSYSLSVDPEGKKVVDNLQSKIGDLSTRLEHAIDESTSATKELNSLKAQQVFAESTSKLASTEREVIEEAATAAKVQYVNDAQYKTAITSLITSYFPSHGITESKKDETKDKDKGKKDTTKEDDSKDKDKESSKEQNESANDSFLASLGL